MSPYTSQYTNTHLVAIATNNQIPTTISKFKNLKKKKKKKNTKSSTNHCHNHDTTTGPKHQPNRSQNDQTQPTIGIHTMTIQNPHIRTHPKSYTHNPIKRDMKVEGRKGCRYGIRDDALRLAASCGESVEDDAASDQRASNWQASNQRAQIDKHKSLASSRGKR